MPSNVLHPTERAPTTWAATTPEDAKAEHNAKENTTHKYCLIKYFSIEVLILYYISNDKINISFKNF